jgi:CRP/FNR family transcriptional regulator, cyclic AMP receptor protein
MDAQVIQNFFRHFPLLDHLTMAESEYLAEQAEFKTARKHGYIYLADESSNYLCLLVKGTVKTGIHAIDGREVIKTIQHPFSFFGELGLVGEPKRTEFAAGMNSEVSYITIRIEDFRKIMLGNYALSQAVMLYVGERLRKAERQWESLILKDVRSRIVDFLKDSADQRGRQVGYEMLVKHSLTQQDIANLVGASRQTVTAILNDLRKSNLIYFNRNSILIRDIEKLY